MQREISSYPGRIGTTSCTNIYPLPADLESRNKSVRSKLIKVNRFLNSGTENREFQAVNSYRGRQPWPYSIPLEDVIWYLKISNAW